MAQALCVGREHAGSGLHVAHPRARPQVSEKDEKKREKERKRKKDTKERKKES